MASDQQPLLPREGPAIVRPSPAKGVGTAKTADAIPLPGVPFPEASLLGTTSKRKTYNSSVKPGNTAEPSLRCDENTPLVGDSDTHIDTLLTSEGSYSSLRSLDGADEATAEKSTGQNGSVGSFCYPREEKVEEAAHLADDADDRDESTLERYTSCRWTLAYMVGWMTTLTHCVRNCMSMTLVCMGEVHERGHRLTNDSNATEILANETSPDYIPRDKEGFVLSGYFYGYLFTPLLFGTIAERYGVKRIVAMSMTLSAALTFLTPAAVYQGVAWTVTCRVLLGVLAGTSVPCGTIVWAAWAPRHEKAKLITVSFIGSSLGTTMANVLSGFLCSIPIAEGWPFIFYTYGGLSAVWVLLWMRVAFDSPEDHPRIHWKELKRIQKHRTPLTSSPHTELTIPWRSIFTSIPFLALTATQVAFVWILNILNTFLPLYINRQLHFTAQLSGVLSSLPFLCAVLASALAAVAADCIQSASLLSVTNNRKLFQTIGLVVPGCTLCALGFVPSQHGAAAVVLMVVAAGFHRFCLSGCRINPLDLSPRLAGTLAGITQTVSNLIQTISVIITSALIAGGPQSDWITVFITTGTIGFVGAAVFLVFGSGDQQPWA